MNPARNALLVCLATASLLALQPALSAASPRGPSGATAGARPSGGPGYGGQRSGYQGGYGHYGHSGHSGHYGYYRPYGYYGAPYWGWGLGLSVGVPWGLGWYDPYWGGATYYPPYAYGPAYGGYGYGYACGFDEDCTRATLAQGEAAEPTTVVPPAAPGEYGGPTQRPLHLNYCDSAQAWFPHVRTCPGGWRLIRPEYNRVP